jgi:hypothetical protein
MQFSSAFISSLPIAEKGDDRDPEGKPQSPNEFGFQVKIRDQKPIDPSGRIHEIVKGPLGKQCLSDLPEEHRVGNKRTPQ